MDFPGKKIQDSLQRLKKNVEKSYEYFKENYDNFNKSKRFVFVTTLNDNDKSVNNELSQPNIECNLLEAFISRLRGEFSKQEPSIEVTPGYNSQKFDPRLLDIVEGHARHMEAEARKNGVAYDIITDLLGGGFSVLKIWTEYENDKSFDQVIKFSRAYDPTLCGFDPMARESHKGDGRYCFELFPKTKEDFKSEYPDVDLESLDFVRNVQGFNWSYSNEKEDILMICDLYEKKKKKVKIVKIAITPAVQNMGIPEIMTMDEYKEMVENWANTGLIEQPPAIMESRTTDSDLICRYRFIENKIIEYVETDYSGLPLIFVTGNPVTVRNMNNGAINEYHRSYVHNAIGTQKLANVAIQSAGNELENIMQNKIMAAKESIDVENLSAYTCPQIPGLLTYNAFLDREGVTPGDVPLPPPQIIARPPIPQEILSILQLSFQLFQNILGSFDSSLGINNNQLSGVAIVEGATQSNAAAMPFIVGYIQGLNRMIELWIKLFPKYYLNPRTIPTVSRDGKKSYVNINSQGGVSFKYDENTLNVKVEAGPNYAIQKSKTLQTIMGLSQSMPIFGQFINTSDALLTVLKLLDLPGAEQLQLQAEQFVAVQKQMQQQQMQAAQQQSQQPNPMLIKLQNERANIQRESQKDQVMSQVEFANIALKQQQIENDKMKLNLDAIQSHNEQLVQLDKHQSEKTRAFADMAMKAADMSHNHAHDVHKMHHSKLELANKIADTVMKHNNQERSDLRHEASESPTEEYMEH